MPPFYFTEESHTGAEILMRQLIVLEQTLAKQPVCRDLTAAIRSLGFNQMPLKEFRTVLFFLHLFACSLAALTPHANCKETLHSNKD